MFAVYAAAIDKDEPLKGLELGERPEPSVPEGWTTVRLRAAALNHHDLWSLRGVGLSAERLPMILGCDAAGVDEDGAEVIVHSVIATPEWRGDETLDPKRTLLSELHQGALAERVDAVMEPTGEATWKHSIRALKPGGTIVISGATTGDAPPAELTRIFFLQLSVIGSTMGTREELERLIRLCVDKGVRPAIHSTLPLTDARTGFETMLKGETAGKIVFTVGDS